MSDRSAWMDRWEQYLASRAGRYEWRCARYRKAAICLAIGGLGHSDTIVDVGAGWTEFDYYLRRELDWRGRYVPIDGAIDGVDLDRWAPVRPASWYVALELIEHLHDPPRLVRVMRQAATRGVVISTPNADTVDVPAMDPTHVSPISASMLRGLGCQVEVCSLYGQPNDGLVAWWYSPFPASHKERAHAR